MVDLGGIVVIGVDPGPTTGIVALHISRTGAEVQPAVVQCGAEVAPLLVSVLARRNSPTSAVLAVESFVTGRRAGRVRDTAPGRVTRELIGVLWALPVFGRRVDRRPTEVKPWATDSRLRAAGLYCTGMPHARDAARQALFAAVHDFGQPDPLSRRAR